MLLAGLCILVLYLIFKSLISRLPTWAKPRLLILYVPLSSRNLLQHLHKLIKQSPIIGNKQIRVLAGEQENAKIQVEILSLMEKENVTQQSVLVIEETSLQTQTPAIHNASMHASRSNSNRTQQSESIGRLTLSQGYLCSKEEKRGWPRLRKVLQSV